MNPNRLLPVAEAASMVVHDNPLVPATHGTPVAIGTPLRDLSPITGSPLMLRLNGQWVLRKDWWRPALPGDVIEWHVLPQGGNNSRTLTQILVVIVALVYGFYTEDWATAFKIASYGLVLTNALIPIKQPTLNGATSPESVYTVSTAANQARLNQPIPVIYGRMLTYPDYAGQPYSEFDNTTNDQYFHAVYCVGQGKYTVERLLIEDTPLSHYSDVTYEWLEPGDLPSVADANVVTAGEVIGQELIGYSLIDGVTHPAKFVGGYSACGPGQAARMIGVDVIFPEGIGNIALSTGDIGPKSVSFRCDARYIDDFGEATGAWFTLGNETITRSTRTPQRLTFKYPIGDVYFIPFDGGMDYGITPGTGKRVEVRMVKTSMDSDHPDHLEAMHWGALRAYLDTDATLCPTATHLAIRIRATEQLSGTSQRRINVIVRRLLRTWSSGGGWTAENIETRNPMWARLDKLKSTSYGDGLADSRIDLQTHADLAAVCDERQDHFDMLFDSKLTSIDADRTILQSVRAVPFQRAGVCTLMRDQLQTLPVTAYTSRDIAPGSMSMRYALATEITADAVIVEYFNNRAWDWRSIQCNAPGVTSPVNIVRQRLMGITGAKHAEREGLYLAAQNVYRRKFPTFTTEMQGMLPAYGSLVLFHPSMPGWGQAGDVAFWDSTTLTMGLSEPAVFTVGAQHFISLRRDDGSMTDAIEVTPGSTEYDVVLASAPDFELVLDDANRERPKYIFGAEGQHRIPVLVLGISKKGRSNDGATKIEITTVAEDYRVHAVDNALLPGPGEIQDPVDSTAPGGGTGGGDTGGGTLPIVTLQGKTIELGDIYGSGVAIDFTLRNDGTCAYTQHDPTPEADWTTEIPGQWLSEVVEPSRAADFEVKATVSAFWTTAVSGDALNTWLSMGTTRTWTSDRNLWPATSSFDAQSLPLRLQIRDVASGIVQADKTIYMRLNTTNQSP